MVSGGRVGTAADAAAAAAVAAADIPSPTAPTPDVAPPRLPGKSARHSAVGLCPLGIFRCARRPYRRAPSRCLRCRWGVWRRDSATLRCPPRTRWVPCAGGKGAPPRRCAVIAMIGSRCALPFRHSRRGGKIGGGGFYCRGGSSRGGPTAKAEGTRRTGTRRHKRRRRHGRDRYHRHQRRWPDGC